MAMTALSSMRILLRRAALATCALSLCCLLAACGGGGGGGGGSTAATEEESVDPMEGEGQLQTPPAAEEQGKAPAYLVPDGYTVSRLSLSKADGLALGLEFRPDSVRPAVLGTVEGEISLPSAPGQRSRVSGNWVQGSYNEQDRICDILVECSTEDGESYPIYGLTLAIDARSTTGSSITLSGTVTDGSLVATPKGSNQPTTYGLSGATYTLTIFR